MLGLGNRSLTGGIANSGSGMAMTARNYTTARRATILAVGLTTVLLLMSWRMPEAFADPSGSDYTYAGSGSQYAQWSRANRNIRLVVTPTTSMSNDACMDACLDWWHTNGDHYDGRVVRSCRPGTMWETDTNGDAGGPSAKRRSPARASTTCSGASGMSWTTNM